MNNCGAFPLSPSNECQLLYGGGEDFFSDKSEVAIILCGCGFSGKSHSVLLVKSHMYGFRNELKTVSRLYVGSGSRLRGVSQRNFCQCMKT